MMYVYFTVSVISMRSVEYADPMIHYDGYILSLTLSFMSEKFDLTFIFCIGLELKLRELG